jgi:hypothetical protein
LSTCRIYQTSEKYRLVNDKSDKDGHEIGTIHAEAFRLCSLNLFKGKYALECLKFHLIGITKFLMYEPGDCQTIWHLWFQRQYLF